MVATLDLKSNDACRTSSSLVACTIEIYASVAKCRRARLRSGCPSDVRVQILPEVHLNISFFIDANDLHFFRGPLANELFLLSLAFHVKKFQFNHVPVKIVTERTLKITGSVSCF